MNLKKITSFVAVALLATIASTAQANTVKWSMKGDSLTLDPHEQNEGPTTMVSRQIYEALVSRGLDMSIEPQLATGWTIENPTTWVFTLRKGVTFHDGSPLTASDVVFSFNRAKSKTSDFKEYIDSVTSVEAWCGQGEAGHRRPQSNSAEPNFKHLCDVRSLVKGK